MSFSGFKALSASPSPSSTRRASSEDSSETFLQKELLFEYTEPKRRRWMPAAVHGFVLCLYTIAFLLSLRALNAKLNHGADVVYTPARSAMKYEAQGYDIASGFTSPYVGEPRPELDEAWQGLLQHTNIRVPVEELTKTGRLDEAVELPGGGYFAALMVYHQLHCIKRLHHYLYADHYFPNMTKEELQNLQSHNAHCLDMLRQGIQCQGDATLVTMRWGRRQGIPLGNFTTPHECVNWDNLDGWSKDRAIDVFAPGVLIHPIYGPSFPEGKVERIGLITNED